MSTHKPTLDEVVQEVDRYCNENDRQLPEYNIEIKTKPSWDDITFPVHTFAKLLIDKIKELHISNLTTIQSFDIRALKAVHAIDSSITLSLLVEDHPRLDIHLEELDFIPEVYSPDYKLLNKNWVEYAHEKGMKVIPWTINEMGDMIDLIQLGVDGIITDYPDLIEPVLLKIK